MTVVLDAAGSVGFSATNVASASYTGITVGSGANRALLFAINLGPTTTVTGITATWDSAGANQSMTQVATVNTGSGGTYLYIFGLLAPVSGNKTLSVSWTGSAFYDAAAISFTGVNQASTAAAFVNSNSATALTTSPVGVTITSATGNISIATILGSHSTGAGLSAPSGTAVYTDNTNQGTITSAAMQYKAGATSNTLSWTAASGTMNFAALGIDIVAAATQPNFNPTEIFKPPAKTPFSQVSAALGTPLVQLYQAMTTIPGASIFSKPFWPPNIPAPIVQRNAGLMTNPIPVGARAGMQAVWDIQQAPLTLNQSLNLPLNAPAFTLGPFKRQPDPPPFMPKPSLPSMSSVVSLALTAVVASAPFFNRDLSRSVFPQAVAAPLIPYAQVLMPVVATSTPRDAFLSKSFQPILAKVDASQAPSIALAPVVTTAPFFNVDFSRPYFPRTQIDATQDTNQLIFNNPIPFSRTLFPPVFDIPGSAASAGGNNLILGVGSPITPIDWSKPFQPIASSTWQQPYNQNLYQVVAAQMPPFSFNWAPTFFPRTQIDATQDTNQLIFANPLPFSQLNWSKSTTVASLPPSPFVYPATLYPVVAATTTPRTAFLSNPFMPRPSQVEPVHANVALLTATVVSPPVIPADLSKSSFPKQATPQPQGSSLALSANLGPWTQTDFNKPSQPLPAVAQPYVASIALLAPPVGTPIVPFDWSKPFFPRSQVDASILTNPNLFPPAAPQAPFVPVDWSKPYFPRTQIDATQDTNQLIFNNPVPFAQLDWSKPVTVASVPGAPFVNAQPLLTAIPSTPITLRPPFLSKPVMPPPAKLDVYGVNLGLFPPPVAVAKPFAQLDWSKPFPVAPLPGELINLILFPPAPFVPLDISYSKFPVARAPTPAQAFNLALNTVVGPKPIVPPNFLPASPFLPAPLFQQQSILALTAPPPNPFIPPLYPPAVRIRATLVDQVHNPIPTSAFYVMQGAEGTFVINGQPGTLVSSRNMSGAEGTFVINGLAATMLRSITISGAEGSFIINGKPATELRLINLIGAEGSFIINGGAATELRAIKMSGAEGAFVINGQAEKVVIALSIRPVEGAFVINGQTGLLGYVQFGSGGSGPHNHRFFNIDVGLPPS
jgi:hypothetical protein